MTIPLLHPIADVTQIEQLRHDGYRFVDAWDTALPDLQVLYALAGESIDETALESLTRYAVFDWRRCVVRLPEESIFHRLRTARNCILITDDEQRQWSTAVIAVAGLSVGGSVLNACALTGARHFRIADLDVLGPTNLNRLLGSVCDLGTAKSELARRRVAELDPYCHVEVFSDGYGDHCADAFFGEDLPAVVFEEMDDLRKKVELRLRARAAGVPVVMVTDNGDDVIVDVERYDLDPEYLPFHGSAGDVSNLTPAVLDDPANRIAIVKAIVGDGITSRTTAALAEVGRTIASWPQLGTAATLAGAAGAAVGRRIVCGEPVASGRWAVTLGN